MGRGSLPHGRISFKFFYNFEVMFIKDELIMPSRLFMLALFSSVVYLFLYLVLPPQLYFAPGILIMFFLQMLNKVKESFLSSVSDMRHFGHLRGEVDVLDL